MTSETILAIRRAQARADANRDHSVALGYATMIGMLIGGVVGALITWAVLR